MPKPIPGTSARKRSTPQRRVPTKAEVQIRPDVPQEDGATDPAQARDRATDPAKAKRPPRPR